MKDSQETPRLKLKKDGVETVLFLEKDVFTIGRLSGNDLKIPDSHISRTHAEISREGPHFKIKDMSSKSGTYVNGERLTTSRLLQHGDRIVLGRGASTEILFLVDPFETTAKDKSIVSNGLTSAFLTKDSSGDLQHVSRFLEGVRHFSAGVPQQEVLEVVLDMAIEISEADRAFLILMDDKREPVFHNGRSRNKETLRSDQFHISRSVLRDVLDQGKRVDMTMDSQPGAFAEAASVVNLELSTVVCIPLWGIEATSPNRSENVVIGALYLDSKTSRRGLSRISEGLLESLARDAGSVIMNMKLLKESRAKELLEMELETAREIQTSLLPDIHGAYGSFDVCAENRASRRISGDFYDLITMPDGRIAVVIADISGKGIPAAILASLVQGALFVEVMRNASAMASVQSLNHFLVHRSGSNRFVSLFLAILTPDGEMTYVSAGHNPPILIRASGEIVELAARGIVLGVLEQVEFEEKSVRLEAEDIVLFYTDGVTESANDHNEFFGEERLLESASKAPRQNAALFLGHVLQTVLDHTAGRPCNDDLTLLVVRRLSATPGETEWR